eukprot:14677871-Alexandrium_andersonii.AAC.1
MQNRFKRSELELCGPSNDLNIGPRRSRWVRVAPLLAWTPNPPTKRAIQGVRSGEVAQRKVLNFNLQSTTSQSAQSSA